MRSFATLAKDERAQIITNAAQAKGMAPAIVEKDFWVCWTLDYLFARSRFGDLLSLKGGTSLSKGFGLIQRFSEDIDLIMDWRLLSVSRYIP
jgi:predicted nucleotidyltransferase component of viral defense system